MADKRDGDTCLCLACGHMYEAPPGESGENPAVRPRCPACRSTHVLNLTQGSKDQNGCGADGDGFTFGYG